MPAPAQPAPQRQTETAYDRWRLGHAQDSANARRRQIAEYHRQRAAGEARARAGGQLPLQQQQIPTHGPVTSTPYVAPAAPAPAAPGTAPLSSYSPGDPTRVREYADRDPWEGGQQPGTPVPESQTRDPNAAERADPAMFEALRRMMSRGGEY